MRRNTAGQSVSAMLVSKTDGSAVTSGTTTVYVTGDAGTQATGSVGSGAATHEGNGLWSYAPAQAETNYANVCFTFVNTSAVNANIQIYTLAYDASGQMSGVALASSQTFNMTGSITGSLSGSVGSVTGAVGSVTARVTANTDQLAGQTVTAAAGVTFPTSVASPTNITAGTITTVTNLTNLPTIPANWLTAAGIATGALTATKFAAGAIDAAALATDAVDEIRDGVWAKTQAELTGDPGATPTVLQSLALPYMAIRNKRDTDSGLGTDEIHNSAGTVILTATISDSAGVFSKAKYA